MSLQHRVVQQRHTTNELCALLAQITTLGAPHVNPKTDQQDALEMECFYLGHWMTPQVMALLRNTSKGLNGAVSAFAKQYKVTVSANWFREGGVEGILTRVQELQKVNYVCLKLEPLRETLISFTMNNVRFHYPQNVCLLLDALKKCTKIQHLDFSHTSLFSVEGQHHGRLIKALDNISEGMNSLVYLNLSDTGMGDRYVTSFVKGLPRNGSIELKPSNVDRPLSVYINNNGYLNDSTHTRSFPRTVAEYLDTITVNGRFNLFLDIMTRTIVDSDSDEDSD
jgi:hypothetical protein